MSDVLRAALALGVLTSCAYLLMRVVRSQGITGSDVVEAVGLALTPSFVPGAIEMIVKAFGRPELPIFNAAEDRMALTIGGAMLIVTFFYCNIAAFRQAWTDKRRP
jgi:hypothetical protein